MASSGSSRRQVPFGGHQLAEYALAAALVVVGVHMGGRPAVVLSVAGGVVGAFAFVTKGPLGALRIIPRRLHVYLDLALAGAFAVSPLLYVHDLQIIAVVLSEAVAVLLVRMSLTTEIVPRPRPSRRGAPAGVGTSSPPGGAEAVSTAAATAGRVVGSAVARVRGSDAPLVAARGLGRATGQARRLGRAARAAKEAKSSSQSVGVPPGSPTPSS
ncbi:MAG: hypothetical protein ABSB52_08725 [Acidimicrobiales bacterium]|jgi:hypothetical protein